MHEKPASPPHVLPDADATEALGRRVGAALPHGATLYLQGELGAGKTTFARGIIAAWTGEAHTEAPSPSFTLVQVYDGPRGVLTHADLYRLNAPEETLELGLEDAAAQGALLVEWPERLGPFAQLGAARLHFRADGQISDTRRLHIANAPWIEAIASSAA
jgi:tRNA threonylcarbamoyl adenosine modification protein YjeE